MLNKKILYFVTHQFLSDLGGQKQVNFQLLKKFSVRFDVNIFNIEPNSIFVDESKQNEHYNLNNYSFKHFLKFNYHIIRQSISQKFPFTIILSGAPIIILFSMSLLFFLKLHLLFHPKKQIKIIYHSHVDPIQSSKNGNFFLFPIYYLSLLLATKFLIDKTVVLNEAMKKTFSSQLHVPTHKLVIIPNPIRDVKSLAKQKPAIKLNVTKPIITTIARIDFTQKDHPTLIKAFKLILKQYPKATLLIIGDGLDKQKLQTLIKKLNIQNNVKLFGYIENPFPILKKSNVFVLSSFHEGHPLTLMEAQALGIPIVATDCPTGPREILDNGKAGILVPVGNYQTMSQAILKILEDKQYTQKLVSNGFSLVQQYDVQKIIKKWHQVLSI